MVNRAQVPILVADDDLDDCQLLKEALQESRLLNPLCFAHDGEELLQYLRREGNFKDEGKYPMPGLILLDLNMPKKSGQEALLEIKNDPRFRHIPVIVLTTSKAEEDIFRSYNLGVNSFITKPISFTDLVEVMRGIGHYWMEIVHLPRASDKDPS